jgi:hypothetical protein
MATSGNFDPPVATDNDPAVQGWQWEESADDISWADVGTAILTDFSGETTQSFTIESATIAEDQTYVRCRADYPPDGPSFSASAILTVT